MMAATMAIWRQPVAERRAVGSLWLTWFLLLLFMLGMAADVAIDNAKSHVAVRVFSAIPMGMLLILWWFYLCCNVKAQCHPAALQLVPALRERIVRALVLAWIAIIAVMTVLAGLPTGYPLQVALVTALVLVEMSFAGTWRGIFLFVALSLLPQLLPALGPWLAWCLATPAGLTGAVVLVLVDGAVALRRLPRAGCAAPGRPAYTATWEARRPGPGGRPAGWLDRSADPQPSFLQPLGRSWFGPHWLIIASVAVICAALRIWATSKGPSAAGHFLLVQRMLLAVGMVGLLALLVYREAQRFAKARTEQALLCLTPGAPGRDTMNRVLAALLLRGFARSWLILGLVTLAALAALDAPAAGLARMCAVWLATVPLVTVTMRDFARAGGAPGLAATPLMTVLIGAAPAAINGMGTPAVWLALAGGGMVCGLGLAWWRRGVMLAAPPALPAGRFT